MSSSADHNLRCSHLLEFSEELLGALRLKQYGLSGGDAAAAGQAVVQRHLTASKEVDLGEGRNKGVEGQSREGTFKIGPLIKVKSSHRKEKYIQTNLYNTDRSEILFKIVDIQVSYLTLIASPGAGALAWVQCNGKGLSSTPSDAAVIPPAESWPLPRAAEARWNFAEVCN